MENNKYKNKLLYFITIVVVIIVYLIIHLYTNKVRDDIYLEKSNYENSVVNQPINNIISIINDSPIDEDIISLSFARKSVSIKIGDTMKLIVRVRPASLASTKLTWKSSDPSIVSVDSNGNIKGLKEGVAIITVTSPNGKVATIKVTVVKEEIKTKKINLSPNPLFLDVGFVQQIDATIEPENATNGDLKWISSNPKIATVDENGVVKGISPATTTVIVKTKDGTVTSHVTVIVRDKTIVEVGGTKPIDPNKVNKPAGVTNKDLVWESSNPNIATVDKNGVVTGVTPGIVTIIVKTKDGKIIDQITVVVRDKITVGVGEKETIDPNKVNKPAGVTNNDLVWESSNPNIATVDKNGVVTGVTPGTTTIIVKTKDGKVIDQITVIVRNKVVVEAGSTKPIDPNTINKPAGVTNNDLVWESSNPSIATVDSSGKVTGITPGTTTIIVKTKDGKVIDQITVIVRDKITVGVGEKETIDPNKINKPVGVTNNDLVWVSSDPSIATVDSNGKVTGITPGTTTIIVKTKDGKVIDKVTVIVRNKVVVEVGSTKPIDPNAINKPVGVTNNDLVWVSSNSSIATVDKNGVVTGVTPGATTVIVKTKDGKVIDEITVIVRDKVKVEVGSTKPIDTSKINKPANVTNNDLVWESSNPSIATVDSSGKVTGVTPGTTTIIVKTKDGKVIDKVTVIVRDKITVEVGEKEQIDPNTINKPAGVTNNDLVWESSNPSIATVDSNGKVTGVTPGTTTIIVKTKDGEVIDKVTVIVEPSSTPTDIVFIYDYDPANYIDLYGQFPTRDDVGKNLQGDKHTQDFKIRFNNAAVGVHYIVTMEKLDGSDLREDWTKAFLVRDGVDVGNCYRSSGKIKTFNEYENYKGNSKEKIIYEGTVTSALADRGYEEYTFRMWISEDVSFTDSSEFSNKTFKTRINVYAYNGG